jgi:thiopeptide-type bacteriocin biosynthesis protein
MHKIKPTLLPGSEWLYFKIYCSEQTANQLFKNSLNKLVKNMTWFFIRYHDPDFHLRIRIKINAEDQNDMSNKIYKIFNPLIEKRVVWKIQYDTYQREIDRYSEKFMLFSEELFSIQSIYFIEKDPYFFSNNHEEKFYQGIKLVDDLIKIFINSPEQQLIFLKQNFESFKTEFLSDKFLVYQLNEHYKKNFNQWNLIFFDNKKNNTFVKQIFQTIKCNQVNVSEISHQILSSHVHMLINRYFTNNQRKYEYIIYHHLFKYHSMKKWHNT